MSSSSEGSDDGQPSPPPDPVHHPGVKAAWIGALAGGITAAIVSGWFGMYTAQRQIEADDRRDTAAFLRSEQKVVYQDIITLEREMSDVEDDVRTAARRTGVGAPPTIASLEEYNERLNDLSRALDRLKLVGSSNMVESGGAVVKAVVDEYLLVAGRANGTRAIPSQDEADTESYLADTGVSLAVRAFVDRARVELGVEDVAR